MKHYKVKNFSYKPEKPSRLYIVMPLVFLFVYAGFLLTRSIWLNYQTNKQVTEITDNISGLKDKIKKYEQAIKYYNSESFTEKEARSKLGYQKKGETVIALPPNEADSAQADEVNDILVPASQEEFSQPNYVRWWQFLFKGQ